jgi:putative polyketide hydroxylase
MPPAGALGANTAIQDAHNLAWKLAFVLHGLAGPALLDTYEAERRPVGKMALDQAMLRWHTRERHSGDENFVDDLTLMFGGQYVSRAVSNQQPVCRPKAMQDGTPGTRAPHVWLDDGTSTLDVYGPGFTLLHNDTRWVTTAATLQTPVTSCRVDQLGRQALLVRPDGYVAWRGDSHAHLPVVLAEILDNAGIAT